MAAFWTDIVDWRFVFLQAIPLGSVAGVLVWYYLPQDQPKYERLRMLDWRGILLLVIATGALSTMLYQGDRLDWFNSKLICVLALASGVATPLLLINEWFHLLPLLKLQMLGQRNLAYGVLALFTFLLISRSGLSVPLRYLQEVQGYRPLQSNLITLEIAVSQLVMLPAIALLLDYERVDSRLVSLAGTARRQLAVLKVQRSAAEAAVKADEAQLEQAKLNLSYTQIRTPIDGTVGERSVQAGNYVGPGTTLMTVVPLDQVDIEANYREVDLLHVRRGQPVTIHVDAYDIDLQGKVDSVPPASGAAFAPIAPNNATGNFTKIVQRLPVKIVVTPGQPLAKLLRGLSVETTIHTGLEDVVDEQRRSSDRVTGR
jgi:hypothetical protein